MSQRFEGKNVDEALGQAAEALGVERYKLTYHVVLEKRGFLGGVKRVVIEAEVNEAAAEAPVQPAMATASAPSVSRESRGPRRRERGGGGGGGGRGRGQGVDRERSAGGGGRGRRGRREHSEWEDERSGPAVEIAPAPDQGPESEGASAVRVWCEDAIEHAGFDVDVRTEENDTQVIVKLYGRDASRFIERNGELLDALQVLANKALVGRRIEKDVELDCAAFKEKRMEELGERARETADRVRRDGREQLLPAMSPIERRIIHLALQDDAEVMTESRGDGFYKRVAIKLRPAGAEQTSPES